MTDTISACLDFAKPADTSKLLSDAADRAARYLESLPTRRVFPASEAIEPLASLAGSALSERGASPEAVIAELDALAAPATVATAGPRYFGFVTGGTLPATVAAGILANAWDQNAFSFVSSPAGALLEEISLHWLTELLGLPSDCTATLTTGATLANFTALAAARHALLERAGWDVEARGMFGAPEVRVVVGEEVHPSVRKGLGMLGLTSLLKDEGLVTAGSPIDRALNPMAPRDSHFADVVGRVLHDIVA